MPNGKDKPTQGQSSAPGQQELRAYTRTNPDTGELEEQSFPKYEHRQRKAEGWKAVEEVEEPEEGGEGETGGESGGQ